jgi:cobalt-zinc-cadmium efflux system membrane fusion protein
MKNYSLLLERIWRNKLVCILCGTIVFWGSCTSNHAAETLEAQPKDRYCLTEALKATTTIEPIQYLPIQEQLTLSGKVEYNENDLLVYKSLVEGVVTSVKFELGDYVQKGQVLAIVRSPEMQQIEQQLFQAEKRYNSLKDQVAIHEALLADGMSTKQDLHSLTADMQVVAIERDKLRSALNMFQSIGNGLFQIIAPKNGYIVQKDISAGQSIIHNDELALFSISNLKEVWVMVNIYASHLKHVQQGDSVKVRTVAYPDQLYRGVIDKIYNVFDDKEHVIKARVVLENKDLKLMPGLSADIIIDKKNNLGMAYALPNQATVFNNNKEYVVVYKDDCQMEVRRINPIARNAEYTFVADTFAQGEQLITSNALLLVEELNQY